VCFDYRLIDDVLGKSSDDRVPIEKVMMIIWQFRDDPQVVKFMTRFVAKVSYLREGPLRTLAWQLILFSIMYLLLLVCWISPCL
jgi:hypothetical protein